MTSSKISRMPCFWVISRNFSQESRFGQNHAHIAGHGFDDHAGQIVPVMFNGRFHGFNIVEGQRDRQFGQRRRDAGASRNAQRRDAGAGLDKQRIGMAVITARRI